MVIRFSVVLGSYTIDIQNYRTHELITNYANYSANATILSNSIQLIWKLEVI